MDKALKSKVWLKSGGYIVINQTEALVAIDINTGKYVGKTRAWKTRSSRPTWMRSRRLCGRSGCAIWAASSFIDFIDMDERRNRQRVMQALEEELRHDRAPSKVLQFNDFGLVRDYPQAREAIAGRTIGAPCPVFASPPAT